MPLIKLPAPLALMLPACLALLSACSTAPVVPAQQALIPPLPVQARQPAPPTWCRPTCSAGLSQLLDSWPTPPTRPASPAKPASAATTP